MGEQPVGRHTDSVIYRPLVWGRITLSDQRRSVPGAPVFAVVVRGIGLADEASGAAKDSLILVVPGPLRSARGGNGLGRG